MSRNLFSKRSCRINKEDFAYVKHLMKINPEELKTYDDVIAHCAGNIGASPFKSGRYRAGDDEPVTLSFFLSNEVDASVKRFMELTGLNFSQVIRGVIRLTATMAAGSI